MTELRDVKMMRALGAVADERVRQHNQRGLQDHPDIPEVLYGAARSDLFDYLGLELPEHYQADVAGQATAGELSWALILIKDVAEAAEAAWHGDAAELRSVLVRAAAVLVQWIEGVDRRPGVPS